MRQVLAMVSLLFAISCRDGTLGPQPIEAGDMCARCKMAISQRRFAAEIVDKGGNFHKFDDIGCMRGFVGDRGGTQAARSLFVTDYDDAKWLDARRAFYVRSESIQSPMASGLLAVGDRDRAAQHAKQLKAQTLTFPDLFR